MRCVKMAILLAALILCQYFHTLCGERINAHLVIAA